jgi:hypothetical protein
VLVDWLNLERAWIGSITDAIIATAEANPEKPLYAGAFWLLYGDHSSLLIPAFGLNSESSDPESRWHPPDWRWSVVDSALEPLHALDQPFRSLDLDEAMFRVLWDQHIGMLAAVSHSITNLVGSSQLALNRGSLSPSFFVGILDFSHGDAGIDFLRRSVDARTIAACGILESLSG